MAKILCGMRVVMIRTAFCFACFLLITLSASAFGDYYSGGAGEPNDPFQISTPEDLNDINNHPWEHFHKHFVLTNDIDLSGYTGSEFNMIGHDTIGFRGVFDGRGHTISNFMYAGTDEVVIGLFAQVASAGTQIKNIRLTNVDVSGESGVGGLVGGIYLGTIQGCYVSGKVSGTMYSIGGLTAVNSGLITDCFSNTNVTGTGQVGGLVGSNQSGVITRSFSRGEVSATEHSVGGLVGMNYNGGKISNCYSNCIVTGKSMVGGLVGDNTGAAKISSCYSTGRVEAEYNFGGLIGYNDYAAVTTSFGTKRPAKKPACADMKSLAAQAATIPAAESKTT